jgi:hypothetical protein
MSVEPVIDDPFALRALGIASEELPERWAVRGDLAPRLAKGGLLPHSGRASLWELPAPVVKYAGTKERLVVVCGGGPLVIERAPQLPSPQAADRSLQGGDTVVGGQQRSDEIALRVLEAIQSYGNSIHRLLELVKTHTGVVENPRGDAAWFPSRVVTGLLHDAHAQREPPVSLIVKVQERLSGPLEEIRGALRRMLRRQRRSVPVSLASSIDAGCLQWLARQPGRTLEERAGPKQRVLAVIREDTVDTFENRVLKRCLEMCVDEASRYLRMFNQRFARHPRVQLVKQLLESAVSMLRLEEFAEIRELDDDSRPNYALQFERRYSHIWWAYQVLKRRRREEDELWTWRHRVWSETVLLDFAVAAESMASNGCNGPDRELGLLRDPHLGFWLHPASRLPAYSIGYRGREVTVGLDAPLHRMRPSDPSGPLRGDIEVTLRQGSAPPYCAAVITGFVGLARTVVSGPCTSSLRLAIRPHGRHDHVAPLTCIESGRGRDRVISWPTWGAERVDCAKAVLTEIIETGMPR